MEMSDFGVSEGADVFELIVENTVAFVVGAIAAHVWLASLVGNIRSGFDSSLTSTDGSGTPATPGRRVYFS
jgi:hypothetical protein